MAAAPPQPSLGLSREEARRLALAAQGFGARRTATLTPWSRTAALIGRLGLLQIDSVNVLARAHYLPVYSRAGPYDRAAFDRRAFSGRHRALFEYWAHEASLLPLAFHPLMRWRMERAGRGEGIYGGLARFAREQPETVAAARQAVRERGPIAAADLADGTRRSGSWWGWHNGKAALEFLFWAGEVTTARRRGAFERVYDLTERVLPPEVLALPTPDAPEAVRRLAAFAAGALGVATETDIRDYFRLPVADARRAVAELAEAGDLVPVSVEDWPAAAWMPREAALAPASLRPSALLSPFDPLIFHRPRAERLFDFHYRIEIYTPAEKRTFGYYVLPFLHGGRIAARLDLKADRAAAALRVLAAHREPGRPRPGLVPALAAELALMAGWLGLDRVEVTPAGDLGPELRVAAGAAAPA